LIARIDAVLPQTQCRQCGYRGCRPYAEALAAGCAETNQCPPGGEEGARELAALLGVAFKPVDSRFGATKPPAVAVIDEALCIGCTLCIQACRSMRLSVRRD
jgi:electron transport complex protein RnfB